MRIIGPPAGGSGSSRGFQSGVGSGVGGLGSPGAASLAGQSIAWESGSWTGSQLGMGVAMDPQIIRDPYNVRQAQQAERIRSSRAEGARWGRTGQVPVRGPGSSTRGDQGLGGGFQGQGPIGFHPQYGVGRGAWTVGIQTTQEGQDIVRTAMRRQAARIAAYFETIRESDRKRTLANRAFGVLAPPRRRGTWRSPDQLLSQQAAGYGIRP
jgi:hypothetical protein